MTLAEIVWPREYLYTETEMYSINDVNQLHSGELITTLTSARAKAQQLTIREPVIGVVYDCPYVTWKKELARASDMIVRSTEIFILQSFLRRV